MDSNPTTRRDFLKRCARYAGAVAVAGIAGRLALRADADKVWQLDANLCTTCLRDANRNHADFTNPDGWARCATECVLKKSAVRVVNDFSTCGYCMICPGYHDVAGPMDDYGIPTSLLCPKDAIIRRPVGHYDPHDPNNNFYEYRIDEDKCNGCGICVEHCRPPMGNASLRLQVRHNICADCNQCAIAAACPAEAFFRSPVTGDKPGYGPPSGPDDAARKHS